jgi:hypothetical protein
MADDPAVAYVAPRGDGDASYTGGLWIRVYTVRA